MDVCLLGQPQLGLGNYCLSSLEFPHARQPQLRQLATYNCGPVFARQPGYEKPRRSTYLQWEFCSLPSGLRKAIVSTGRASLVSFRRFWFLGTNVWFKFHVNACLSAVPLCLSQFLSPVASGTEELQKTLLLYLFLSSCSSFLCPTINLRNNKFQ